MDDLKAQEIIEELKQIKETLRMVASALFITGHPDLSSGEEGEQAGGFVLRPDDYAKLFQSKESATDKKSKLPSDEECNCGAYDEGPWKHHDACPLYEDLPI